MFCFDGHLLKTIPKAFRFKLYPNLAQRQDFLRFSGSCRWLWNHLLEMNVKQYEADKTFLFRFDMQKLLPGLKKQHPWLALTPADSLQRVCRYMDGALKRSFTLDASGNKAGFPKFKKYGSVRSFYVANNKMRFEGMTIVLPKVGAVKFRSGRRIPFGAKILGATVRQDGNDWYCVVQCQLDIPDVHVEPTAEDLLGGDAGVKTMMTTSDGNAFHVPKKTKRRTKAVRRLNKKLARQKNGSKNREKTRRRLAHAHAKQRRLAQDARHKASRQIVDHASFIVLETLLISAMSQALHLGKAIGETGIAELVRQILYKADWDGVGVHRVDRFFPSTQTCSCCGNVKQGKDKLRLQDRTYRCDECGNVMDRDLNAAMNLRREGLHVLGLIHEDYHDEQRSRGTASGSAPADEMPVETPLPGRLPTAGRHGSMKQESRMPDVA